GPWTVLLLSLGVAIAATACPETKADPADTFRHFAADVHGHRAEAAWSGLTRATQEELLRRHHELKMASREDAGADKAHLYGEILFDELGLLLINSPETIEQISPGARDVNLRVSAKEGTSAEFHMVLEGKTWKVDLMNSLKPAAPPSQKIEGASKV